MDKPLLTTQTIPMMKQFPLSADDLLLFVAIAERLSLARTAERLAIPKATLSRRLAALESQLGQRLLLRTTRRLALTEFGREFLDHCRRVAEEVEATQSFAGSREESVHGRLRLSMPGDYARHYLATPLATFSARYPTLSIDIDLSSRRVDLIGEGFDLVIRMGELENDATLTARRLGEQRFGLYASPIYLALQPAPQHPDDLLGHSNVRMQASGGALLPWRLQRDGELWQQVPPGRLNVTSPEMVQQLLLAGAGIGALPEGFVQEDLRQKRLLPILPEWQLPVVPVWAVLPMRRYLPNKCRLFLEHLQQQAL